MEDVCAKFVILAASFFRYPLTDRQTDTHIHIHIDHVTSCLCLRFVIPLTDIMALLILVQWWWWW